MLAVAVAIELLSLRRRLRAAARLAREHALLVAVSVLVATLLGVPLGLRVASRPALEGPVLAVVGVLQTVPALALLALLIPLLGRIGAGPALVALTLYALLPIVQNTVTGVRGVPAGLQQAACALGLRPAQVLRVVTLPLAAPVVVAGVKTAAVTAVGTATIAAFVGAGGFGERIATGLALNDSGWLIAGAVPAAGMALAVQAAFAALERRLAHGARADARPRPKR